MIPIAKTALLEGNDETSGRHPGARALRRAASRH
jgi:hypothetical protein